MFDRIFRGRARRPFQADPQIEVDDELSFHLEQRVRDYVARGMDPVAARAAALERFGDLTGVRHECAHLLEEDRRAEARRDWIADLRQDLRFGVRSAFRAPLFSLLAVVTLALGIGANAAVFSVVKSVLLDPLPYADADRLVRMYEALTDGSMERSGLSAGTIEDVVDRQRSLQRLGIFYPFTEEVTYVGAEGPRLLRGAFPGAGFFQTLGVRAALGRALTDADATTGAPRTMMLSHAAWQRDFSGDPRVLGRSLRVDGNLYEVVGVLPRGFVGPMGDADLWFPLDIGPALRDPIRARRQHWLGLVGRLKPNATADMARRELAAIGAQVAREHPADAGGFTITTVPLRDAMAGDTRTPLIVLMASAGLVLLITCANLAGALLSRTISRRKEFAVRVALGAGRGRLVRQLLTESMVLALAGGAVGLLLAMGGLSVVRGLAASALPAYAKLSLDTGAVLVASVLALGTGIAFGLAPAVSVSRANAQGTLRDEGRGSSETRRTRNLRGALVAGQIALCVSLLAGAGLLVRSLIAMTTAPLGFNPDGVLTLPVSLPRREYPTAEARARFYEQLEQRLRTLPGVTGVASASELPSPTMNRNGLTIEGVTWPQGDGQPFIIETTVSDDYFRTMGIPLRRGRTFGAGDRPDVTPAVVISESMASRYWPNGNAIGAHVRMGPNLNAPWSEVVGIVGDVRTDQARPVPEPTAYASTRQEPEGSRIVVLRTRGDPRVLMKPVQRELAALSPSIPLQEAVTLRARLAEGLAGRRLPVVLMTAFGGLALLLASVGVYAMFANMAAAREREFGVRVALGSSRGAIAGLVLRQGAVWMAAGLAGGAFGVAVVARLVRELLFGVRPFDPVALGAAVAMLLVCGMVALLVPVRRATRADPIAVLR